MIKCLSVPFFCLFLVMIGFGMTLPVFAFYTERIEREASRGVAASLLYGFTVDRLAARVRKLLASISDPPTQAHQEAQGAAVRTDAVAL